MAAKKKEKNCPLAEAYPNVAELVLGGGWIELGYEYNTRTYARALDEGGYLWTGGDKEMTLEELLEAGVAEANREMDR